MFLSSFKFCRFPTFVLAGKSTPQYTENIAWRSNIPSVFDFRSYGAMAVSSEDLISSLQI